MNLNTEIQNKVIAATLYSQGSLRVWRRFIVVVAMVSAAALLPSQLLAQETTGLKLPEDIAAKAGQNANDSDALENGLQIEERRIGGRLERVTVRNANGLDEVFENIDIDSMWVTEDKELGQRQNVRRWTIGTW